MFLFLDVLFFLFDFVCLALLVQLCLLNFEDSLPCLPTHLSVQIFDFLLLLLFLLVLSVLLLLLLLNFLLVLFFPFVLNLIKPVHVLVANSFLDPFLFQLSLLPFFLFLLSLLLLLSQHVFLPLHEVCKPLFPLPHLLRAQNWLLTLLCLINSIDVALLLFIVLPQIIQMIRCKVQSQLPLAFVNRIHHFIQHF